MSGRHVTRSRRPGASPAAGHAARTEEAVARLARARVLPVATIDDPDRAADACAALARGGIRCIEVAFRSEAAAAALERARAVEGFLLGAGTVLSAEQARAAADAGADFAVAPGLNEEVVDACRELGLPFFPGIATPSELDRARRLGLRTLKVFPAEQLGGPGFLRALSAAYPDVGFLPTGGVGPDTLAGYLAVPAVVACAGTWLVKRELLREGRFDEIERLAREAAALAR
ncbi:MAG TPA: bifunctional 4-hydroxy-2-oxoglutarate aldolase/2-dehydro-3-deoxy-phosphogluconate aldolase [Gaiellaceae bacterium]|nr:bifunctional 4-hydroxy-2-oxoglutarate aldolase/2-dehydro-3-deoxy-phosphogluconate aldolase [Gaiellaceae bacterium]